MLNPQRWVSQGAGGVGGSGYSRDFGKEDGEMVFEVGDDDGEDERDKPGSKSDDAGKFYPAGWLCSDELDRRCRVFDLADNVGRSTSGHSGYRLLHSLRDAILALTSAAAKQRSSNVSKHKHGFI
jgi:hypothetical protein